MTTLASSPAEPAARPDLLGQPPLLLLCLVATWLIWGSTYLAIKLALPSSPPFLQMGTRFLLAGGTGAGPATPRRASASTPSAVLMLTQGAGFQASPAGLTAIAIACVTWSLGSVLSQRALPLAPGATGFASEMLCGGAVLMLMSAIHGETMAWPPQPLAVAAWLYLVVFGSLIAFNAYMLLLARAPAGLASSYTFVNPVIAMLLGVAFAGEHVTGFEWAAVSVVLAGVALLLWRRRAA